MYSVSEVASKIGVARSTLLYYERIGIIRPSRNPKNGYRQYSREDLGRLTLLRQLKRAGLTIKESCRCLDGVLAPDMIEQRLATLEKELQEMQMARDVLHALFCRATGRQPEIPETGNILPRSDWVSFYEDMQAQLKLSVDKWGMRQAFGDMEKEIRIDKLYGDEYSYACLLLRKQG